MTFNVSFQPLKTNGSSLFGGSLTESGHTDFGQCHCPFLASVSLSIMRTLGKELPKFWEDEMNCSHQGGTVTAECVYHRSTVTVGALSLMCLLPTPSPRSSITRTRPSWTVAPHCCACPRRCLMPWSRQWPARLWWVLRMDLRGHTRSWPHTGEYHHVV